MNLNSDDYFSCKYLASHISSLASDVDKRKFKNRSPTPQAYSNDHTMIKEDGSMVAANLEQGTDAYVDEMKKGTSNILVRE